MISDSPGKPELIACGSRFLPV